MVALLCTVKKEGQWQNQRFSKFMTNDPADQPNLYAVFDLVVAISPNAAITISSALTRAYIEYYLRKNLGPSAGTEQVKDPEYSVGIISLTYSRLYREVLESLEYVRSLSLEKQKVVFASFIAALQNGYGTRPRYYCHSEPIV